MIKTYYDNNYNFKELFNTKTGFYLRTDILRDGKETGVQPFMRSFPSLLDIGIMGSCPNGKSGICAKSGVQCYQNGLTVSKPDMSLVQYESIMKQCENKTFQVALGGRGDPNLHLNFKEILECTVKYGIVPNYTTSGINLTDEQVELTKQMCGSAAVSFYRNEHTTRAIQMFLDAGVTTNIHYVLGNNTIDEAIERLKNNDFPKGINAIIFLLHKPVGQGQQENVLQYDDPRVKEFYNIIDNLKFDFDIGFDTCNIPAIINFTKNIDSVSTEPCESGKFSAYIDSDMNMMVCSFDNQLKRWSESLNSKSIEDIWNGKKFSEFRNKQLNSCGSCKDWSECMGGCAIIRGIVLCNRSEKSLK